jgi:hypothetical protein
VPGEVWIITITGATTLKTQTLLAPVILGLVMLLIALATGCKVTDMERLRSDFKRDFSGSDTVQSPIAGVPYAELKSLDEGTHLFVAARDSALGPIGLYEGFYGGKSGGGRQVDRLEQALAANTIFTEINALPSYALYRNATRQQLKGDGGLYSDFVLVGAPLSASTDPDANQLTLHT